MAYKSVRPFAGGASLLLATASLSLSAPPSEAPPAGPAAAAKPGPAPGADAPGTPVTPASTDTGGAPAEVLVLGEALPNLQQQPVSGSLLTEADVDLFRIHEPQDIMRVTPNAFATDSGSRSFGDVYSMRGLANTVFFGAPAVTIYVDDVPFGETFTYAQRLAAVNSVEVLRGPQPQVVGRNTYAGLINIRSRRPTNLWEGEANASYGSYDAWTGDAWTMGPLIADKLFIRLGGSYEERDGYLKNPVTGERVDYQEHWNVNGGLFWRPAPGWEVSLTGSYDEYDDGAPRLTSLDGKKGFYDVKSNVPGRQFRTSDNEALRVSYEGEKYKFLSVTSRRAWDLNPYIADIDFSQSPLGSILLTQDQEFWSQEFRFATNDEKAPFQWNVGAYGATGEINGYGLRNIFTQRQDVTVTDISSQIPAPLPGPLNLTSFSDSDIFIRQITTHHIDEDAFAFFAGASWSGWEPVTLRAGVRADWVRRELVRHKSSDIDALTNTKFARIPTVLLPTPFPGVLFPLTIPTPAPLVTRTRTHTDDPTQRFSDEWFHVTPTVGLDYQINESMMAFAKTTWAFKPGGFSAYADDARYAPFDEETAWITEAGLKAVWLDSRLTTNLTGFWNEVEDYQVERSFTQVDYAVFNADEARAYGLEFETLYDVCDMFRLQGSVGWTHARFRHYTDPVTGKSLDGNTPPFVPEFDASIAAEFHHPCGLFVRGEYQIVGDTWYDDFNRPDFQQDSFGLLNAAIGWRGANWSVALYGTNLAEEEYYTTMNTDVRTGAPGAPREFGVKAGVRF